MLDSIWELILVKNIPQAKDFINLGITHINQSWDIVISQFKTLKEYKTHDDLDHDDIPEDFWNTNTYKLNNAISYLQQGVEFILKGKIVKISPFLLLKGDPRSWPQKAETKNLLFADFRTIDAQDLTRVYNTFANDRLSNDFLIEYKSLRKMRNAIMHTIDSTANLDHKNLIIKILTILKMLFPEKRFPDVRYKYLEQSPSSILYFDDFLYSYLIEECCQILELLPPSQCKLFFGINKKQRMYICPDCQENSKEIGFTPFSAILRPNTKHSATIYCFICNTCHKISRENCYSKDCLGNVISEDRLCLSCERQQ